MIPEQAAEDNVQVINGGPASTGKKARLIILILYFLLFFSLPVGVSYWLDSGKDNTYEFDARPLRQLKKTRPRFIFLGNSMLITRINQTLLRKLTGEPGIFFLSKDGMMSAYWYLALKNYVAAAGTHPEKVFIFFRDESLTRPRINIDGKFKKTVDSASLSDEPLFRYIVSGSKTFKEKLAFSLEHLYPALSANQVYRDRLSAAAGTLAGSGGTGLKELLNTINLRFNWNNIRYDGPPGERWWKTTPEHLDFAKNLPLSFLPSILQLAKEHHFKLVFVRVQSRPLKEGQPPPQSEELKKYIADLARYLKENDAALYDFTGHPGITLSMYSLTDHIHRRFKNRWTRLFYERLKEEFR